MTEKQDHKQECFRLYWVCNNSGRRFPAGVAFYNEPKGDYRLKIDVMADDKVIYLKPVSMCDGVIQFRVEAAVRKGGHVSHRAEIGVGYAKAETGYPIQIELGPYSRQLVLEQQV